MRFYLAPMEGLTGHIFRNALERYFPGTDRYFTPFIAPDQKKILRTKETRDVLPENNLAQHIVPQILTNNPEHFIRTTEVLQELGYDEVNLNLGCPSGTVVSRGRGSGFLAYPEELDRFLEQIFAGSKTKISIKTRVGVDNSDDAFRLLEIYRKYPLSELIIHPRTRAEFYRGVPNLDLFGEMTKWWRASFTQESRSIVQHNRGASEEVCSEAAEAGRITAELQCPLYAEIPLCYNGNIMSVKDYQAFTKRFPEIDCIMIGRGAIANPGLIRQLKTGTPTDKKSLRAFHDEILEAQREMVQEDKNAMFRMKEIWIYLIHLFGPTAQEQAEQERIYGEAAKKLTAEARTAEKCAKKIRKAQSLAEYKCAVDQLFAECELLESGPEKWNLPQR